VGVAKARAVVETYSSCCCARGNIRPAALLVEALCGIYAYRVPQPHRPTDCGPIRHFSGDRTPAGPVLTVGHP
jgi:hypothetical protein